MVGLILAGAGLFRAGWVANLFSIPVLTGFLGGIAVHIVLSQTPAFLGIASGSGSFFERVGQIASDVGDARLLAVVTGLSCLAAIVVAERLSRRLPGPLLALIGATAAAMVFGLESKGLRSVGAFSVTPPHLALPNVNPDDFGKVLGLAAIIAVVVMAQSAATSRSFPGLPGEMPDIDRDFIGLGAGPCFPACSAPCRSTPARRAPP